MTKKRYLPKRNPETLRVMQNLVVRQSRVQSADVNAWREAVNSAKRGDRTKLYDLYENLMADAFLSRAVEKRIEAITNAELTFIRNGKSVEEVDDLIDTPEFEELLRELILSKGWGKSVVEVRFDPDFNIFSFPRKHIKIRDSDKRMSDHKKFIATRETDLNGYDYTGDENIIEAGGDYDLGFLFRAAVYVIYKRGGFGDWAQFVEIFGMPFLIGKYNGFDTNARDRLFEALQTIGSNTKAAIPAEADIEVRENKSNGSAELYREFRGACNEEILIAVLGNTMTTVDGASRAQGEVHKQTEENVHQSDRRFVQRILNRRLLPMLIEKGLDVAGGYFVFPDAGENLTVRERIDLALTIRREGIPVSNDYIYEVSGIPKPEEKEEESEEKKEEEKKGEKPKETPKKEENPDKTEKEDEKEEKESLIDLELLSAPQRSFFTKLFDFFVEAPAKTTGEIKGIGVSLKCSITGKINLADKGEDPYLIDVKKLFNQALKAVYGSGENIPVVEKNLFDITNNALQAGIETEFGKAGLEFGKKNEAFINEFKKNAAVFAAFKNHGQTKEIVGLLTDENGNLRSFSEFRKRALAISKDYNENWLRTEYNTAVRSARSAVNWKKYEETADLYPNLEYLESLAPNKRGSHLEYVGTILSINHPWWDLHMPPSDWNCQCRVKPTDKPETKVPGGEDPDPVFRNNPGKTAEFLRIKETPYYQNASEEERKEIMREAMQLFADAEKQKIKYKGKDYKSGGRVETPVGYSQNSQEEKKNMELYSLLAKRYGEKYRLLPVVDIPGVKNPDALNLSKNIFSDAKITETANIKNAIQQSIKNASKQKVGEVVIRLTKNPSYKDIKDGIKASLQGNRAKSVKEIILIDPKGNIKRYDADKLRDLFKNARRKSNK